MKQTEESKESREIVYFLLCEDFVKIGKVTLLDRDWETTTLSFIRTSFE